jgi:hypothetical protein
MTSALLRMNNLLQIGSGFSSLLDVIFEIKLEIKAMMWNRGNSKAGSGVRVYLMRIGSVSGNRGNLRRDINVHAII